MVRKERRYSRSMLRCLSKPDAHFMGENHIPNHTPNRKIGFLGVFGVFGRIGGKEDKEGKGPAPGIASGFKSGAMDLNPRMAPPKARPRVDQAYLVAVRKPLEEKLSRNSSSYSVGFMFKILGIFLFSSQVGSLPLVCSNLLIDSTKAIYSSTIN